MIFWDEQKNKKNILNHGISFEEAKNVFEDPYALEIFDEVHSLDEDRFHCIGAIADFVIILVVFTNPNGDIRIISARKATTKEKELYYANFAKTFG